jgi:hypothetical protein
LMPFRVGASIPLLSDDLLGRDGAAARAAQHG